MQTNTNVRERDFVMTGGLLPNVRILDLTGPDAQLCGRILAELGAEVILVEPAEGVSTRRSGPFRDGREGDPEASIRFAALNSGKHSVVVERPGARREILALARGCDAVVLSHESVWRDVVDGAELRAEGTPVIEMTPFWSRLPYARFMASDIV